MTVAPALGLDVRTALTTHRPGERVRLLVDADRPGDAVVEVPDFHTWALLVVDE